MCKTYGALAVEGGGYENLPYDEKTLRNMITREKVLERGEGDATALLDHFTNMQYKDPNLFYRLDIDGEGRLKNVFWADNRCREAYKEFGEVVTFDTTHLTNKYDMPFAQFVRVNHHGQSILLGCGLLSNEEKETFTWLFKAWLDCMNGVSLGGIITDQHGAMKISIEIVFKDTKHRWCLWHIMKKIPENLRRYDNYVRIKSRMKKDVYDSQCPAEFEERWSEMLEKYESLKQNKWLRKLYREKDRWIPCFVKTTFWAGMSTTQRSESMNAFFNGYVHSRTSLKQFVEKFDNALRYKKEKEHKADARSFSKTIPTSTSYKMEKQIQKVYTHAKFKEFRNQLVRKMYCEIIGVQDEIKNGTLVQKYDIQEEVYYAKPPENEDEDEDEDEDDDKLASPNDTTPTEKSDSESESEPEPEVDDDMLMKKSQL